MRKTLIILSIFFITVSLYASNNGNPEYLKKLILNGYYNIAIDYGTKFKQNKKIEQLLFKLLLNKERFNQIIDLCDNSTKDSFHLKYLAKAYIFLKKFDKANIYMGKLKKISPDNYKDIYNLYNGLIYFEKYDYLTAEKYFEKIKDKSDKIKTYLIKIYCFTGNIKLASKLYKSLNREVPYLHALILYKSKKFSEAVKILQQLPKTKDILTLIYNCYINNNQLQSAEIILKKLKNQNNENFYKNIKVLIDYKNYDEALLRLFKLKDNYNKNYYIAKIYDLQSDYHNALTYYFKALNFSKNSKIYYQIASCYMKNHQFSNAAKYFEKVISMQDSDYFYINSLYNAGVCYYKIGDFKASEKFLLKYLRNNNGYLKFVPESLKILADIYRKKGDYVKCIEILTKIEDILDNKAEIQKIDLQIANLWIKLGKFNYAANVYKKYYPVKNKKDIFILEKLGELYLKAGNFKGSNIFFTAYIEKVDKFIPDIYLKIALNFLYQNKIDNAKKYLLEIINNENSGKTLEEALFYMGKINYNLKKFKTAIIYFNKLVLINRFSPLSLKAVKYLAYLFFITKDRESFVKYFNEIPSLYEFIQEFNISLNEISSFIHSKEKLVMQMPDEKNFKYFTNIFNELKNKDTEQIYSFINENVFTGDKVIIYYYAGKILKQKGLEDKANFAFNKFLNSGFVPKYFYEYKEILPSMLLYYFIKKDYKKILNYYPIFSHINNISENSIFIIGVSAYKIRLDKMSEKYLKKFINISKDGNKIFRASFILDRMNFLDEAAKGYKKSLLFLKKSSVKIEALYWLGEIYRKKGKLKTALNYYLQIKLLYPFDIKWTPTASFQAAKIFEQIGSKNKALKEYIYISRHLQKDDPRKEFVDNRIRTLQGEIVNEYSRGNN